MTLKVFEPKKTRTYPKSYQVRYKLRGVVDTAMIPVFYGIHQIVGDNAWTATQIIRTLSTVARGFDQKKRELAESTLFCLEDMLGVSRVQKVISVRLGTTLSLMAKDPTKEYIFGDYELTRTARIEGICNLYRIRKLDIPK